MDNGNAVEIHGVSKIFRIYHEKNQYLKTALLRGRRARFEEFLALNDLSFHIPMGSTFGIIGSNGSGKSTLLKCLVGILSPEAGSIKTGGRVAALLELGAGFHPELTGRENIFLNGAILGMSRHELVEKFEEIVDFSGLQDFIDMPVKNYSSGMSVRLGFAVAINVNPDILIIDEVLAVGDASFQLKCYEKIEDFRNQGKTIVLVSHGLSDVVALCDTVAWIDKGSLMRVGQAYEVVGEYVGESHGVTVRENGETDDRWGTGQARILNVEFLDSQREPLAVIESGKPAIVRVNYDVVDEIDSLVVGFRINHIHGTILWSTSSKKRGAIVTPHRGVSHVEIEISSFPLLAGTFDLSVDLCDESEVHSYDHWEKGLRFDVKQGHFLDEGIMYVDATFTGN